MAYVYVADGDAPIRLRLQQYLGIYGYSAVGFDYLSDLGRALQKTAPDLLVMELEFEDGDGLSFLKQVAQKYRFPVIIASARSSESDRIMSFEFGCDDFVAKPYSMLEVTLRASAVLRRRRMKAAENSRWYIRSTCLSINWDAHIATLSHIDGGSTGGGGYRRYASPPRSGRSSSSSSPMQAASYRGCSCCSHAFQRVSRATTG